MARDGGIVFLTRLSAGKVMPPSPASRKLPGAGRELNERRGFGLISEMYKMF